MNLEVFKTKCGFVEKIFVGILTVSLLLLITNILCTPQITTISMITLIVLIGIFLTLFLIAYVDFKSMEILNTPSLVLMLFLLITNISLHFKLGADRIFLIGNNWEYMPYDNFIGALILGAPFLLIVLITKEKALGAGDIRMAIITGLLIGQRNILLWLYISIFSALIYGLVIGRKKGKFKNLKIPFVPFMVLGIVVCILTEMYAH